MIGRVLFYAVAFPAAKIAEIAFDAIHRARESSSSSDSEGCDSESGSGNSSIDTDSCSVVGRSYGEGRSYYGDRNRSEDLTGFRAVFGDDNG